MVFYIKQMFKMIQVIEQSCPPCLNTIKLVSPYRARSRARHINRLSHGLVRDQEYICISLMEHILKNNSSPNISSNLRVQHQIGHILKQNIWSPSRKTESQIFLKQHSKPGQSADSPR